MIGHIVYGDLIDQDITGGIVYGDPNYINLKRKRKTEAV